MTPQPSLSEKTVCDINGERDCGVLMGGRVKTVSVSVSVSVSGSVSGSGSGSNGVGQSYNSKC